LKSPEDCGSFRDMSSTLERKKDQRDFFPGTRSFKWGWRGDSMRFGHCRTADLGHPPEDFSLTRAMHWIRQFPRTISRTYATTLKSSRGTSQSPLRVGLIPADGIGNEVIPVTLPSRLHTPDVVGSAKSATGTADYQNHIPTSGCRLRLFP
jgi:hypothetical protein